MLRIDWEEYSTDDFLAMDKELTDYYAETFGEVSLKYREYNAIEDVTDFFIGFQDGFPVAICAFKPFTRAGTAEIKRLYVRKEYRKSGVGSAMLEKVEQGIKRKGYARAVLTTGREEKNHATVAFYLKRGYGIIESFGRFIGDDHVVCMEKELK